MLYLSLQDDSEIKMDTDDYEILRKIKDHFTHYEKDYYWTKTYQSGIWDGKTCLVSTAKRTLPYGLFLELYKFLKKENYKDIQIEDDLKNLFSSNIDISYDYNLKYYPYNYQKDIIENMIKTGKGIYVSATGSGKSLIIAYVINNLYKNKITKKHIIIVPTLSLITQFKGDLIDYGIDEKIIGLVDKDHKEWDNPIVVSTWQTLQSNKEKLKDFDFAVCDEVHRVNGKQLQKIMKNCAHMNFIFGVTGTMPDHPLEKRRVISYIGPVLKEYNSKWLSDNGFLSQCNIKHIKIKYKNSFKGEYREVKQNVFEDPYRLQIIKSIVNRTGNILILVEKVKDEGEFLEKYLKENIKDKEIVFLSGRDKADVRENWRQKMENEKNIVLIATYGIYQLGVNVKSLKDIIIASSSKSKIRVLQSIGRSLRKHEDKSKGAYIWDLHDQVKNLQKHGNSRERFYIKEEFNIETINMNEKNDKNINKLFS